MVGAACDGCLRRTDLIAAIAPCIDIEWRRRSAPAGVLSLPDEALIALDPRGGARRRYARFAPAAARAAAEAAGLLTVCRCSGAYPDRLRELDDPPAVLHVAGRAAVLDVPDAVAIVGARRGTGYGLEVARALGRGLAASGLPVVSGMAMGVDSAAHVGALERAAPPRSRVGDALPGPATGGVPTPVAGGTSGGAPVVAVLAGSADVPYPPSRRRLYARIVEHGCIVSELPPGAAAFRWCFVARNRIIAGLAALTVVVEAAERSGSLTTADFATQLGRPVGAVPGPVTSRFSAGTNGLLAAGASVVRDTRDVLDELLGPDAPRPAPVAAAVPLEPRLRGLLDAIERGHGSLAELAAAPAASAQVLRDLTDLELRGLVRREFGGRYVRAHEGRA